jgi:hypothetical protein
MLCRRRSEAIDADFGSGADMPGQVDQCEQDINGFLSQSARVIAMERGLELHGGATYLLQLGNPVIPVGRDP